MSYQQGIEKAVRAEAGQWASLETGQTLDEWMTVYPELVKTWRRSFVRQVEAFLSAQPTEQWCTYHDAEAMQKVEGEWRCWDMEEAWPCEVVEVRIIQQETP